MAAAFITEKFEKLNSYLFKFRFNLFPAFRASGGKIIFVSHDYKEIHTVFQLKKKKKNYHGTGFGGAIYSSMDPIYPMQLIFLLGSEYVVWDKSATIDYIKPVTQNVYAKFEMPDAVINEIKEQINANGKYIITLPVEYVDKEQTNIYAKATKTIYIASREYYNSRKKR